MASFLFGFVVITLSALGLDRLITVVSWGNATELKRIEKACRINRGNCRTRLLACDRDFHRNVDNPGISRYW